MMGTKTYQEKMFYSFSLSQRVREDHILRKVAEVVDLGFVRELVADKYSHTGQPSIAPEVIFKMMLIGYLYGITSERRLAEDIGLNMAYLWYLGYDLDEATPHHSVISKARSRYGQEVFERFFQKILGDCVAAGLVRGEKVFADSTIIKANASMKSVSPRAEAVDPRYGVKEFVGRVFAENPVEDSPRSEPREDAGRGNRLSNKTHVSKTDPDATVLSRGQKLPTQLCYKEHLTVDGHKRVITAVVTTPSAVGDESQLGALLDRQPVPVQEVGADSKYGTFGNYQMLQERGVRAAIPPWSPGPPSRKHFHQNRFQYDPVADIYRCPHAKELKRGRDRIHLDRWTYHARKRDCKACPLRAQCISPTLQKRRVFRHIFQEAKDRALIYLETPEGRQTMRERKIYAEWANAESKNCHGLRRARCRGLAKVAIQVLFTASVQNLKRLVSSVGTTGRSGAVQVRAIVRQFFHPTLCLIPTSA